MKIYKVIVVDDEDYNFILFEQAVKNISQIEVCAFISDPEDVVDAVREHNADIVFMDVEMPGMSGIEAAERLMEESCVVVFLTAFSEYAIDAFKVNAMDYIVKPVNSEEIIRVIKKIDKIYGNKKVPNDGKYSMDITGSVSLRCGEREAEMRFQTSKSEELLYLLMIKGPLNVDKNILMDTLWPETDPEKAAANLYTSFYRLKKTFSDMPAIRFSGKNNVYSLLNDGVDIDYYRIINAYRNIVDKDVNDTNISFFEDIINSFHGELLKDKGYSWIEGSRERINSIYIRASVNVGNYYIDKGNAGRAKRIMEKAFLFFPYNEELCLLLCGVHDASGDEGSCISTLKKHIAAVKEELDMPPSQKIKNILYKYTSSRK